MIYYKKHAIGGMTTLGIDGIASEFFEPETREELIDLLLDFRVKNRSYRLLGNGSNIFLSKTVIKTPVIYLNTALSAFRINQSGVVRADAGVDIRKLINACAREGLRAPVELLTVPATVGGALFMNAGRTSFEKTISQDLVSVDVFDGTNVVTMKPEECNFGHRSSLFHNRRNLTILGATFRFENSPAADLLRDRKRSLAAGFDKCYRNQKSAGSVFKSCDWQLMTRLRGVRFRRAGFAPSTTNCILNYGGAKPFHVKVLITVAQIAHLMRGKKAVLEVEVW